MRSEFLGLFFLTNNFILARFEICTESAIRHGALYCTQFRKRADKSLAQSKGRDSNYLEITHSFIQNFMVKNNIVYQMQSGRLSWSPDKESHVQMLIAFHLGVVQRGFLSKEYHEDYIENVDETYFVINVDNGRTLGFRGDQVVKYADVVSGGEAMTMVVRITRGRRATIKPPHDHLYKSNSKLSNLWAARQYSRFPFVYPLHELYVHTRYLMAAQYLLLVLGFSLS